MKYTLVIKFNYVVLAKGEGCIFGTGKDKRPYDVRAIDFYRKRIREEMPDHEVYNTYGNIYKFAHCKLKREERSKVLASKEIDGVFQDAFEAAKQWLPPTEKRHVFGRNPYAADFGGCFVTEIYEGKTKVCHITWDYYDHVINPTVKMEDTLQSCYKTSETKKIIYRGKPITLYRVVANYDIMSPDVVEYYDEDKSVIVPAGTKGGWVDAKTKLTNGAWVGDGCVVINSTIDSAVVKGNVFISNSGIYNFYLDGDYTIINSTIENDIEKGKAVFYNTRWGRDDNDYDCYCNPIRCSTQNDVWDLFASLNLTVR